MDQCQFVLRSPWPESQLCKKPTRMLVSSGDHAVSELSRKCKGNHVHCKLEGKVGSISRTKHAEVFPPGLCRAIIRGFLKDHDQTLLEAFPTNSVNHEDDDSDFGEAGSQRSMGNFLMLNGMPTRMML